MLIRILSFYLLSFTLVAATAQPIAADDSKPDNPFRDLLIDLHVLHDSLKAMAGMRPQDREIVVNLRREFADRNAQLPGNAQGIAGELQLSMWLDDLDRVDTLYEQLAEHVDDRQEILTAHLEFLSSQHDFDRMLSIMQRRMQSGETFGSEGILFARALFNQNKFDEAQAALDNISEAVMEQTAVAAEFATMKERAATLIELWSAETSQRQIEASRDDLPRVKIATLDGDIVIELFEDSAPNTVANFITLAGNGFYDGLRFHRVTQREVRAGNPLAADDVTTARASLDYRIRSEHVLEGARNHFAGTVTMVESDGEDTGRSRFAILKSPVESNNGKFTVFGRVIDGMDVVRDLTASDRIQTITVLRKRDHDYSVETLPLIEPSTSTAEEPPLEFKFSIPDDTE